MIFITYFFAYLHYKGQEECHKAKCQRNRLTPNNIKHTGIMPQYPRPYHFEKVGLSL